MTDWTLTIEDELKVPIHATTPSLCRNDGGWSVWDDSDSSSGRLAIVLDNGSSATLTPTSPESAIPEATPSQRETLLAAHVNVLTQLRDLQQAEIDSLKGQLADAQTGPEIEWLDSEALDLLPPATVTISNYTCAIPRWRSHAGEWTRMGGTLGISSSADHAPARVLWTPKVTR